MYLWYAICYICRVIKTDMKNTSTFSMSNAAEADALIAYFHDCGISATRKGSIVKAAGDTNLVFYLYNKFVQIVLI